MAQFFIDEEDVSLKRTADNRTDFTQGNIEKQLYCFAAPLFLSSLLQIVYSMVDMIIVGQVMGKIGLSAVSIGGDVVTLLTFLVMGFSNAGQVIIAQYLGAGKEERLGKFIGTMYSFLMLCAAFLSIVCIFLRSQILYAMQTPPEAFTEAFAYSTVCMCGLVFIYGYNISSAVLRGMGDSVRPLVFICISAILNIILDLIFVGPLSMGAFGAGLETVISQGTSFLT